MKKVFNLGLLISAMVLVFSSCTDKTYTVTFDSQGGTAVAPVTNVAEGSIITEPTAPTKEGYFFGGWYKDADCTNAWNFASDVVNSNITLYAKWATNVYTVTFDSQGGTAVAPVTNVAEGSIITEPTAPTKEGYFFCGWYKDADCTNAWNFATDKVNSDITLYAKWATNVYTVTFDSQGGSAVAPVTNVTEGSTISKPTPDPTKEGYFFGGWYKEAGCTNAWNFASDVVNSDITLYAKWATNGYTVTFDSQGGSSVAALTNVADGSTISQPTNPTKEGFIFSGWYQDVYEGYCIDVWNFASDVVTGNITLYAKWNNNNDIPYTEYSLEGTSCRWTHLSYSAQGAVVIINSSEELTNYITCTEGSYFDILFYEYTLLLISGYSTSSIPEVLNVDFFQESINEYTLNLAVFPGFWQTPSVWQFAMLIPKISDGAIITLNVKYF